MICLSVGSVGIYSPEWLEEGVGEQQRGRASGVSSLRSAKFPFKFCITEIE